MNHYIYSIAFAILAYTPYSLSENIEGRFEVCLECQTSSQFQAAAEMSMGLNNGRITIGNIITGQAQSYFINYEREFSPAMKLVEPTNTPTSLKEFTYETSLWLDYLVDLQQTNSTTGILSGSIHQKKLNILRGIAPIPVILEPTLNSIDVSSASTVLGNSIAEGAVSNLLRVKFLPTFFSKVRAGFSLLRNIPFEIEVIYSDGSKSKWYAGYPFNSLHPFVPDYNSAVDIHNNRIVTNISSNDGSAVSATYAGTSYISATYLSIRQTCRNYTVTSSDGHSGSGRICWFEGT